MTMDSSRARLQVASLRGFDVPSDSIGAWLAKSESADSDATA